MKRTQRLVDWTGKKPPRILKPEDIPLLAERPRQARLALHKALRSDPEEYSRGGCMGIHIDGVPDDLSPFVVRLTREGL